MMNIKIQVIIAVIVVTAICVIINMIRAKNLELRYALAWLIVGVGILVLDCFPGLMAWMARKIELRVRLTCCSFWILFFAGDYFCFNGSGIAYVYPDKTAGAGTCPARERECG